MIKEENSKFYVYNKEGTKRLSGAYETKEEAVKRLQEIEYFKLNTNDIAIMYDELSEAFKDEFKEDAEYQGKEVTLNDPFRTPGESKKFAVYVRNDEGNVVMVRFGDPDMEIKRDDPEARKAFRARHNCEAKKDKTTPGYWSCKFWASESVSELIDNDAKILTVVLKDTSVSFDIAIDDDTGFLTVDAVIARTGIQKYLNSELGEAGTGIVGVYRPDYEVTAPESVASFTNVPVTDNHPNEMVTADNINKYMKGSISNANVVQLEGEKGLSTKLTITDKDLIKSVKDGKKELSVGYSSVLVQKDGTYKGEEYKYIQTNIKANHVAVVDAGRCGGICKMMVDEQTNFKQGDEDMPKMKIDGNEYEVDQAVIDEFEKLKGTSQDMEKEKKDMEEKVEAMDGKLAVKDAEIKKLKQSTNVNDADVNKLVDEKLSLIKLADLMDKVEVKVSDSTSDIKKAIAKGFGVDVEGKSETFLDAVIEVKQAEMKDKEARKQAALNSHKNLDDADTSKSINVKEIEDKEI